MYYLLRGMSWCLGSLSISALERFANMLTVLCFDILRLRRRVVLNNLNVAFGHQKSSDEIISLGRKSVYNFIMTFFEFLRSEYDDISKDIEIVGRQNIQDALDKGKGVYLLCFHLGNWEAMCSKMSRSIVKSHVLVKKVGSDSVDKYVTDLRTSNQFHPVARKKKGDGLKAIREILSRNHVVGFVIDQARPGEPRLPFFGKPAQTNTSFAAILQRVPAPIIPGYIRRVSPGKHILEFLPEMELEKSSSRSEDITKHSTQFNELVESVVRQYPEHYFWMHNRWK